MKKRSPGLTSVFSVWERLPVAARRVTPSGALLGIPVSILATSPFRDFLAPGLLLFVFVGLAPLATIYALITKPQWKFAEQLNFCDDMH